MDLLRRLVFVEAPPSGVSKIKGTDTRAIVSVLLECRRFTHPGVYSRELLESIGPAMAARKDEWGIDKIELYRPVAVNRPIVFFMELTRRYRWAKWLCGLKGQPSPPRYTLSLCPRYDAILEIRFKDAITPAGVAGIRALVNDAAIFERPVMIGSGFQVEVLDTDGDSDVAARVNVCFLIHRPPGESREACQSYWSHQHATLALDNLRYNPLTRYRQVHTLPTPLAGLDDNYDGVVFAEKQSIGHLLLQLSQINTARFNNTVVVDESHFTYATPVMLMRLRQTW